MFKRLMGMGLPRQSIIIVKHNDVIKHQRATAARLSREAPSLEEHEAPVHMRGDAESEIALDFRTSWFGRSTADVLALVEHVVERMLLKQTQPVQAFRISSVPVSDDAIRAIICNFPKSVRATIHTLCVRHNEVSQPRNHALFPFGASLESVFPRLTTIKLHKTGVDLDLIHVVAPQLTSLQLSLCPKSVGWHKLAAMTGLRDLGFSIFNMHDAASFLPALEAIKGATWLTAIKLHRLGALGCAALSGFTALTSLSLCTPPQNMAASTPSSLFQAYLDMVASKSPGLRRLELMVVPGICVPACWTQLEYLHVSHKTHVPHLLTIRNLVIDKTLAPYDAYPLEYHQLCPLPRNLVSLHASYNALPSAVRCGHLRQISWTPVSRDGEFQLCNHISLLMSIMQGFGAWPLLDRVLILQESVSQSGMRMSREDKDLQNIYNSQLLQTLASRKLRCCITHVTIHQAEPGPGTFEALYRMPSLRSVTLIGMAVNITRLRNLLRLPCVRLLELIGVAGVDAAQVELLRKEVHPGGKVLSMELVHMDVMNGEGFDWAL